MGEDEFRVIQDGKEVAWSNSLADATRYFMQYMEDGFCELQAKEDGEWNMLARYAADDEDE